MKVECDKRCLLSVSLLSVFEGLIKFVVYQHDQAALL